MLDPRLTDLCFEGEQMPTHECQMLVTLGVIIVEELCEELAIVIGVGSGHEVFV